jgi:hypothetical protein
MGSWRDRSVLAKERQPHGRTDRSSRPARALPRAERANALLKRTGKALERITLDPGRIGAITTAALVLLQLQEPKHAGLKDRADVVRSSLEAFVVKLVPIEQVSPSRTGPGRLAYIQAAPDYGVGMESW